MREDVFNEALYLSSPVFYQEYQKHLNKPITDCKELKKLNISLHKYQSRASRRCTPFGLFAGVGVGTWRDYSSVLLNQDLNCELKRKTRLDMNVLCALAQELASQSFIKPFLKFYPNTSIYLIGDNYRYVEYYYQKNRRFHKINKVDYSDYLQHILSESKNGLTQAQLTHLLMNDEINKEEAEKFINELIAAQLLINQLEPTITGEDYFDILIYNLNEIYTTSQSLELLTLLNQLNEIDGLVKNTDKNIINNIDVYRHIHKKLKEVLPSLSEANLFQTDLYKTTTHSHLNSVIQEQIKEVIRFLNKITPEYKNFNIEDFKKRFRNFYEDSEVPLLVALDTETGIGYPIKDNNGINNLIDDVFAQTINNDRDIKWNLLESHLLRLISESIKHNKTVIEIDERDFKNIDFTDNTVFPTSYSVMFKLLNAITNEIEISMISGSSAINLLGRFAGGDDELKEIIKHIADFEQTQLPNKVIAEIVHLPESRTGNILARPSFRAYEIPYLAKSSLKNEFQIKMDDLFIKIDNDKIVLFDRRLKKEIIPRLGNAHNYNSNSLPLYHFLCDLQNQHFTKQNVGFNWGVLANQFNFLPRVKYKNVILSPAKWRLGKVDIESMQDNSKTDDAKTELFFKLKRDINLPNLFLIVDGDNELLIDCSKKIAIDTFIDTIKLRNEVVLEEYLFNDNQPLIKDTQGNSYTNECIAVFLNETVKELLVTNIEPKTYISKQLFFIGSEWLFYKLYCGAKTADYILADKIKIITEYLLSEKIIDSWFFIRYADPDTHLRFRLHIVDSAKYDKVLQLINFELEPLVKQHLISKIQTDTYRRELERFGDNSIEFVEYLFYTDSVFITNMLGILDNTTDGPIRWQMALRSVDEFLNDFKLTLIEKYELVGKLNTSFFNEHGGKKELKLLLDSKFRALRNEVEEVLESEDVDKEYYPIIELINTRSLSNKLIVDNILSLQSRNLLQINLNDLLASLLHMNLDRLFMGRNRTNEFVVYDLLFRYYKSKIARVKCEPKTDLV